VWREIARQLPHLSTIYVADQAHVPYGSRPLTQVRIFAEGIARFLVQQGVDGIVVACNTASAAALYHLRKTFPELPFVGMEPAVKPAAENTDTGTVGVIATRATFQGTLFASLLERFAAEVRVLTGICPGLVEAIEAGQLDTPEVEALLTACLRPLLAEGIDQLVLGCTHYPFVQPVIERLTGPGVEVIDPAPAVARQVGRVVDHQTPGPEGEGRHIFYTTGDPQAFATILARLVGQRWPVHQLTWRGNRLGPPD
jgi:glutamate racemase